MKAAWLGTAAYFDRALHEDPERRGRLVDLLRDDRWPHRLKRATLTPRELHKKERKGPADGDALVAALAALDLSSAEFSAGTGSDRGMARFDTGPRRLTRDAIGYALAMTSPVGATVEAWRGWVDVALEILGTLDAVHAVLGVSSTSDIAISDVSLVHIFLNDVEVHPRPDELSRAEYWRNEMGDQYIRHPRWGTLIPSKLLDTVGGREAVAARVEPAVMRELNDGVWIELTPLDDALSSEAEDKRAALATLLEPILAPKVD